MSMDKSSTLVQKYKQSPSKFTARQKDELIREYTPLIKFVAQKIATRLPAHIEIDDLVSSGVIGFMDALKKYDPNRDNKFKTYAEFRIRGSILDELRAQDWVPRSVRDKSKMLERVTAELESQLGRLPTDEEIAKQLNMSMNDFHQLVNQVHPVSVFSIDSSTAFSSLDKKSILSLLEGCKIDNPLNYLNDKTLKDVVTQAIKDLPERQRVVLSLYYYEDINLREIGKVLKVTESRVSQLHAQAIQGLKVRLSEHFEKYQQAS